VDGYKIHTVFGVPAYCVEKVVRIEKGRITLVLEGPDGRVVDGYCSNGNGGTLYDLLAKGIHVATGGKVHDGIGAGSNGRIQFFQLHVRFVAGQASPKVGVNLDRERSADPPGLKGGMARISRDRHLPGSQQVPDFFDRNVLLLSHVPHHLCDASFQCCYSLGSHKCFSP